MKIDFSRLWNSIKEVSFMVFIHQIISHIICWSFFITTYLLLSFIALRWFNVDVIGIPILERVTIGLGIMLSIWMPIQHAIEQGRIR